MFTGIITHVGELSRVAVTPAGRALTIAAPWTDVRDGESIAVNGVCLTVTSVERGKFSVAAVATTLERTTVGAWKAGDRVNLERALRAGDRLGGGIVQGHVDGVSEVTAVRQEGDALLIEIGMPESADALYVPQGSVTVDGVSLTVLSMPAPRVVCVSIVDYTRQHTTLGERRVGDRVNVELDVIGKYVRQLVAPWSTLADVGR
jgi:riboflavin synthase